MINKPGSRKAGLTPEEQDFLYEYDVRVGNQPKGGRGPLILPEEQIIGIPPTIPPNTPPYANIPQTPVPPYATAPTPTPTPTPTEPFYAKGYVPPTESPLGTNIITPRPMDTGGLIEPTKNIPGETAPITGEGLPSNISASLEYISKLSPEEKAKKQPMLDYEAERQKQPWYKKIFMPLSYEQGLEEGATRTNFSRALPNITWGIKAGINTLGRVATQDKNYPDIFNMDYQKGIEDMESELYKQKGWLGQVAQNMSSMVGTSTTGMLISGPIGAATTIANLGVMGTVAAGNYMRQAEAEGATPNEAATYGIIMGTAEALTERMFAFMPGGKLFEGMPKLSSTSFKKSMAQLVKWGLKTAGGEAVEEMVMEPVGEITKRITYTPNADWIGSWRNGELGEGGIVNLKEIGRSGAYGFALGLGFAGLGVANLKPKAQEIVENIKSDLYVASHLPDGHASKEMAAAIASKPEAINPEEYTDFVEQLGKDIRTENAIRGKTYTLKEGTKLPEKTSIPLESMPVETEETKTISKDLEILKAPKTYNLYGQDFELTYAERQDVIKKRRLEHERIKKEGLTEHEKTLAGTPVGTRNIYQKRMSDQADEFARRYAQSLVAARTKETVAEGRPSSKTVVEEQNTKLEKEKVAKRFFKELAMGEGLKSQLIDAFMHNDYLNLKNDIKKGRVTIEDFERLKQLARDNDTMKESLDFYENIDFTDASPSEQQPYPQKQPEAKQPEVKQPEVKQPEVKQPEVKQPKTQKVDVSKPQKDVTKFKKKTIKLTTIGGKDTAVKADVYKGLGVHKNLKNGGYSITHVGSGQTFGQHTEFSSLELAKTAAKIIADNTDTTMADVNDYGVKYRSFIREDLLNIKRFLESEAKDFLDPHKAMVRRLEVLKNGAITTDQFLDGLRYEAPTIPTASLSIYSDSGDKTFRKTQPRAITSITEFEQKKIANEVAKVVTTTEPLSEKRKSELIAERQTLEQEVGTIEAKLERDGNLTENDRSIKNTKEERIQAIKNILDSNSGIETIEVTFNRGKSTLTINNNVKGIAEVLKAYGITHKPDITLDLIREQKDVKATHNYGEDVETAFNQVLEHTGDLGMDINNAKLVDAKTTHQKGLVEMMGIFGTKVVFFEAEGIVGGWYDERLGNTVFANVKTRGEESHLTFTIGHETWHQFKKQYPELVQDLTDYIVSTVSDDTLARYTNMMSGSQEYKFLLGKEQIVNEMLADTLGEKFTDKAFWDGLASTNRSLFQKLSDIVKNIFAKLKKYYSGNLLTSEQIKRADTEFTTIMNNIAGMQSIKNMVQDMVEQPTPKESIPEVKEKPTKPKVSKPKVSKPEIFDSTVFDKIGEFTKKIDEGSVTPKDLQEQFEYLLEHEEAIKEGFLDKVNLNPKLKRKRNKQELVDGLFKTELERLAYVGADSIRVDVMNETWRQAVRKAIHSYTQEDINNTLQRKKDREAREQETKARIENPKTYEDLKIKLNYGGKLTPEEQIMFDEGYSLEQKEKRDIKKAEKVIVKTESVGNMDVFEDVDTRDNSKIWVVKLKDRVDAEEFNRIRNAMKSIGLSYSRFKGGFISSTDPTAKLEALTGETSLAPVDEVRGGNHIKLFELADKLQDEIDNLRRPRLANTNKRAAEDASARTKADSLEVFQKTLRQIATAMQEGRVKLIDKIDSKTQVETLNTILNRAHRQYSLANFKGMPHDQLREAERNLKDIDSLEYAEMPLTTIYSDTLRHIGEDLKGKKGFTLISNRLLKTAGTKTNDLVKATRSTLEDLEKVRKETDVLKGQYVEDMLIDINRLARLGIESKAELRAYLREFIDIKVGVEDVSPEKIAEDKIREAERKLIGTKISGYFPTPSAVVDKMLEYADIRPGDRILEPSAGKGNIVDMIKEKNVTVDVIEPVSSLREVLQLKGYNLIASDFMTHTSDKLYHKIIMNPPFEKLQDVDHVMRAYNSLLPGGTLVSIMSESPFHRSDKKAEEFRKWLDEKDGTSEKLPEGSFRSSERPTGVATRLVVVQKPLSEDGLMYSVDKIAPTYYSKMQNVLAAKMPNQADTATIMGILKKEVKQEEIQWSGIVPHIENQKGKINKRELLNWISANSIKIKEIASYGPPQTEWYIEIFDYDGAPQIYSTEEAMLEGLDNIREKERQKYDIGTDDTTVNLFYDGDKIAEYNMDEETGKFKLNPEYSTTFDLLVFDSKPDAYNAAVTYIEDAVEEYMYDNVRYGEQLSEGDDTSGKYEEHVLRGDYRDYQTVLLQAEGGEIKADYTGGHWDSPNVVAFARFDTREDENGKEVLFVEEIQSDWHQKGLYEGYRKQEAGTALIKARDALVEVLRTVYIQAPGEDYRSINDILRVLRLSDGQPYVVDLQDLSYGTNTIARYYSKDDRMVSYNESTKNFTPEIGRRALAFLVAKKKYEATKGSVPDAPFKKTWHELALKRLIKYAAENRFDKIAWTTGEQQSERYNLARVVDAIYVNPKPEEYEANEDGDRVLTPRYEVWAAKDGKEVLSPRTVSTKELKKLVGADITKKAIAGQKEFKGEDLKIGGHGMEVFYDQKLKNFLNSYVKQWDKDNGVGEINLDSGEKKYQRIEYTGPRLTTVEEFDKLTADKTKTREFMKQELGPEHSDYSIDDYHKDLRVAIIAFRKRAIDGGMSAAYDNFTDLNQDRRLAKYLGGKIETLYEKITTKQQGVDITPNMRESVLKTGQPLFSVDRTTDTTWPKDFPSLTIMINLSRLKGHGNYELWRDAKAGNLKSAVALVDKVIKPDRIAEIGKKYPDAILVPVHAEEATGKNLLPLTFASRISKVTGQEVDTGIVQSNRAFRTYKNKLERLVQKVTFDGPVKRGYNYIIIDDVVTQGGTVRGLRNHILENGGNVVAVVSLAPGYASPMQIAITQETKNKLEAKYGQIDKILQEYGIAKSSGELTEAEGRSILRQAGDVNDLRNKIATVAQANNTRLAQENVKFSVDSEYEGFTKEGAEERFGKAYVVDPTTFENMIKSTRDFTQSISRGRFGELERGPQYAEVRQKLLTLLKARDIALGLAIDDLSYVVGKLNAQERDIFERKVILEDLLETAKEGKAIPYGFETVEEVQTELNALEPHLTNEIKSALFNRKVMWNVLKRKYIKAMHDVGFKVENRLTRKNYYRHIIIEHYSQKHNVKGLGKKLRTPTGATYLKKRSGSQLDIVRDYLSVEGEIMTQMLVDIEKAKMIKYLDKSEHNILGKLKREAKIINQNNFNQIIEDELADPNAPTDELGKPISETELIVKKYNQLLAMSFSRMSNYAKEGILWGMGEYRDVIKDLASRSSRVGDVDDVNRTFEYLSELAGRENEELGVLEARTILKYTSTKREFIKNKLGDKYKTWEDLVPETHKAWQPREGNVMYAAYSIPDKLAEDLINELFTTLDISKKHLRKERVLGQRHRSLVLPKELVVTVDNMVTPNIPMGLEKINRELIRYWKVIQLISPRRFAKYNFRNLSGDADHVMMGNPTGFKFVPQAVTELRDVMYGNKQMDGNILAFFERGGMQSFLQVQEMGDINRLKMFADKFTQDKRLATLPARAIKTYWREARLATDYREAILRYANFLSFKEQIESGTLTNYGGSIKSEVDAISDIDDKAYKLANELLGAYDDVSLQGQYIADRIAYFWRFTETNAKFYVQAFKNTMANEGLMAAVGRATIVGGKKLSLGIAINLGKAIVGSYALTALLQLWNLLFFREEEKELPANVRSRAHIILGKINGKLVYFSRLGSLSDFLEWFGLGNVPGDMVDLVTGAKTIREQLVEMLKAPVNKAVGMAFPIIKIAGEATAGVTTYPDVWRPRTIRDRGEYLANSLALGDEYRALANIPTSGYASSILGAFIYTVDAREASYNDIISKKFRFLESNKIDVSGGKGIYYSDKSNALYNYKKSLRYGNKELATHWLIKYGELGGTRSGLATSLAAMNPFYKVPQNRRQEFINSLTTEEKEKLARAIDYYRDVIGGRTLSEEE